MKINSFTENSKKLSQFRNRYTLHISECRTFLTLRRPLFHPPKQSLREYRYLKKDSVQFTQRIVKFHLNHSWISIHQALCCFCRKIASLFLQCYPSECRHQQVYLLRARAIWHRLLCHCARSEQYQRNDQEHVKNQQCHCWK